MNRGRPGITRLGRSGKISGASWISIVNLSLVLRFRIVEVGHRLPNSWCDAGSHDGRFDQHHGYEYGSMICSHFVLTTGMG